MEKKSVFDNFSKDEIFLLPNLLTYFRLILIPFILYFYVFKKDFNTATILIIISFISDILDGLIARTFNMVSNIGKAMDPIADKLTQGFIAIALCSRYRLMIMFVLVFAIGHIITLMLGVVNTSVNNEVNSAKWHGKLCTGIIIGSLIILVLIQKLDLRIVRCLIILMTIASFINTTLYTRSFLKKLNKNEEKGLNE